VPLMISHECFLKGFKAFLDGMDRDDVSTWLMPALRRSYARLAAWMTRGNRAPEPGRLPAPPRTERPSRCPDPSRRPAPPRI
jgi:hypothetical protein